MSTPARKAAHRALDLAASGALPAAWRALAPHREAALHDFEVAAAWFTLTAASGNGWRWRGLLAQAMARFPGEPELVALGCEALLDAIQGRPHDTDPATDDDPARLARLAAEQALALLGPDAPPVLRYWRGVALRLSGPEHALAAIAALEAAVQADPDQPDWRYELALAHKAAGQVEAALPILARLAQDTPDIVEDEGWLWNEAICATGAGRGPRALACWRAMGMTDADIGPDGLPRVPDLGPLWIRVRLGPGEHLRARARPHSPCHGTLLEAAGPRLPAGARILWDGAPVEAVEDGEVPCLPLIMPLP